MSGFATTAESYSRHGAAVIPCGGDDGKRPLVSWRKMTRSTTAQLLPRWRETFADANVGVLTGPSRLTVVDVDSPDDSLVRECLARFGHTPLQARTPRGGSHLFYRSNGEATRTKLEQQPIDIRGVGGFVVVAPSQRPGGGRYEIARGNIDDLERLPPIKPGTLAPLVVQNAPLRHLSPTTRLRLGRDRVTEGSRNSTLWRAAMEEARRCETQYELQAHVEILNEGRCDPPLDHAEVIRIAASAWEYEQTGRNWVGGGARVCLDVEELDRLVKHPDAAVLLLVLRKEHHGFNQQFAISPRGMAAAGQFKGWSESRIRNARSRLLDLGAIVGKHQGGKGQHDPALFTLKWRTGHKEKEEKEEEEECLSYCGSICTTNDPRAPHDES